MRRATQWLRGVQADFGRLKTRVGGGLLLAAGLVVSAAGLAAPENVDPHAATVAALKDVQAAIAELEDAAASTNSGSAPFKKAAHRAINELVGSDDGRYLASAGSDGDSAGALGHLDFVLHDSQSQPWVSPITGAKVNVQAAVGGLQNALEDDELQDFMLDASDALTHLVVAVGRASSVDALGGLRGALGNTVLGVPSHARVTSGCSEPQGIPAYGVKDGYVVYVAVPINNGHAELPAQFSSNRIAVNGSRLVARTAVAAQALKRCKGQSAESASSQVNPLIRTATKHTAAVADDPPADPPQVSSGASSQSRNSTSAADSSLPALYTNKQAEAGKTVFQKHCVVCHGDHLQGTSAPSVGGKDFLEVAHRNGWTLADLRNVIVYNMPFSNPGALSKDEYADVIAYLLAMNCYPAGDKPFPEDGSDKLSKLNVESPDHLNPTDKKLGLCPID